MWTCVDCKRPIKAAIHCTRALPICAGAARCPTCYEQHPCQKGTEWDTHSLTPAG